VRAGKDQSAVGRRQSAAGGKDVRRLSLIDGELPVGGGEGEDGHGGGVAAAGAGFVAAALAPGAVALLFLEEGAVHVLGEFLPVLVAKLEHALGGVVDGVVEEAVAVAVAHVAEDPVAAGDGFLGAVASAQFEAEEGGAGAGHAAAASTPPPLLPRRPHESIAPGTANPEAHHGDTESTKGTLQGLGRKSSG